MSQTKTKMNKSETKRHQRQLERHLRHPVPEIKRDYCLLKCHNISDSWQHKPSMTNEIVVQFNENPGKITKMFCSNKQVSDYHLPVMCINGKVKQSCWTSVNMCRYFLNCVPKKMFWNILPLLSMGQIPI